ncbi:MAG: hypothetical protein KDA91_06895 [Planctomycetaceae bacterium]|nr:hypothetical protein [Planctomycetaceae bacterium]
MSFEILLTLNLSEFGWSMDRVGVMALDVSGCLNRYEAHGISFEYPDIWSISEEVDESGDVEVTVNADGSSFWVIRLLRDCPLPRDVVASWLEAFRDEYQDIDEYEKSGSVAGLPADSRDVEFSCLELINGASVSCVRTLDFSLLVWWQGTDHELTDLRPVLEQMTGSVRLVR